MKISITVLILLFTFPLHAELFDFDGSRCYIPVGLNLGGGGNGGVIGGEASLISIGGGFGYGLFLDVLKTKTGKRTFGGPEIFIPTDSDIMLGFEAGAAKNTKTSESGFMAGVFFFIMKNPLIPYIRYFNLAGKSTCEAGILFKCPIVGF